MAKKNIRPSKSNIRKPSTTVEISPPGNLPWWSLMVIFSLTTIIFFWGHLFGDSFFWDDFIEYVWPVQSFAAASDGIPFWNPYIFNGLPFIGDIQVGYFYPLNRILDFFVGDEGTVAVGALQFVIILHFFIAQIGAFFLMRQFKVSQIGSIIGAISYTFSLIMVCHIFHPMMLFHMAWLPLILRFYYRALYFKAFTCGTISGLLLGMTLLSGHPQSTLYVFFLLGIVFLWFLVVGLKSGELSGKVIGKYIMAGIWPMIIAVGIFSVQLLPTQELADLSVREEITWDKASEGSLQFKQLINSVVPKAFGSIDGSGETPVRFYLDYERGAQMHFYWETAFYFGVIALILGIIGISVNYRNRFGGLLLLLSGFSFLFALGENGPIYQIFHSLPLFGNFRNPARIMFFTTLAVNIGAGFGFDALWKNAGNKKFLFRVLIITAIPLLLAFLIASGGLLSSLGTPEQFASDVKGFGGLSLLFIVLGLALIFLIYKGMLKPLVGGLILSALLFIDLFYAGNDFNNGKFNPKDVYKIDQRLGEDINKFKPNLPDEIFRTSMRVYSPSFMAMKRNQGMTDKVMLVEGYNPLVLQRMVPPVNPSLAPETQRKQIHDMFNVKYDIEIDRQRGSVGFKDRQGYFPRAWMVHKYHQVESEKVADLMKAKEFDFLSEVIIETKPEIEIPQAMDVQSDKVKCVDYTNNEIVYEVESSENSILCFSETWYPAWKVYVDGVEKELLRTNWCFRGVAVTKGKHKVKMRFESSAFATGTYISLATLILAIAVFVLRVKKERDPEYS